MVAGARPRDPPRHGAGRALRPRRLLTLVDLHCHLLPGLDDGPATEDAAVALAARAWQAGTTILVATPHCNGRWCPSPEVVDAGVARMAERLAAASIGLELRAGAEVAMPQAERMDDDTLAAMRLGRGPWLLLESPFGAAGPELERVVDAVRARGHEILLAHPERSPALRERPGRLRALVASGVRCSITAGSLEGRFGPAAQWSALELLRDGLVHSVDSDAHDAIGRPPGLRAGMAAAAARLPALREDAERLTTTLPAAMLDG